MWIDFFGSCLLKWSHHHIISCLRRWSKHHIIRCLLRWSKRHGIISCLLRWSKPYLIIWCLLRWPKHHHIIRCLLTLSKHHHIIRCSLRLSKHHQSSTTIYSQKVLHVSDWITRQAKYRLKFQVKWVAFCLQFKSIFSLMIWWFDCFKDTSR